MLMEDRTWPNKSGAAFIVPRPILGTKMNLRSSEAASGLRARTCPSCAAGVSHRWPRHDCRLSTSYGLVARARHSRFAFDRSVCICICLWLYVERDFASGRGGMPPTDPLVFCDKPIELIRGDRYIITLP